MNLIQNTLKLLDSDSVDRIEIEENKITIFIKKRGIDLEQFDEALTREAEKAVGIQRQYRLKTRDEILRHARTRAKDPRVIAILEKYPSMTFAEWVKWQYPDINPQRVYDLLHKYKDIGVRECIAKIGVRKK